MTVGIPGAGIGGLFYLANALVLPVRGLLRRARGEKVSWRVLLDQAGLAIGIILGIWLTGWLLGFWLGPSILASGPGAHPSNGLRTARLLGAATLAVSVGTLAAVLLSVQVARVMVRRTR
jgi:hypothetical protein